LANETAAGWLWNASLPNIEGYIHAWSYELVSTALQVASLFWPPDGDIPALVRATRGRMCPGSAIEFCISSGVRAA